MSLSREILIETEAVLLEREHLRERYRNARNASTTEPVKVLVFMVGEKGQPLATPVQ